MNGGGPATDGGARDDADEQRDHGAAYYDEFSLTYDRPRGRGYHALIDELELSIALPFARQRDVLEVGCGTGLLLSRFDTVARSAVGVDASPGMLAHAHERGLRVVRGSATDLPFADASFDLVCSFKVLAHVPDVKRAFAEAARVVRPGGTMVLELYNPMSLRYLAKRIVGPQPIGDGRTEADVYTRWDAPWRVSRLVPRGVEVVSMKGIRVVTPVALVHRIPGLASLYARAEWACVDSPLRWFGGFLVVVLRRTE